MNINLVAPINSTGYGIASVNILNALMKTGHEVALWPLGNQPQADPDLHEVVRQAHQNSMLYDPNAPCIRICHQHSLDMFVGRGKRIGFPFFELDTFTERERHHISSVDILFVSSQWAKDVVLDNVPLADNQVCVVPLGVDASKFKPVPKKGGKTVFGNIGKWEIRKGHDILATAFQRAFGDSDEVELRMLCHNPFYTEQENMEWSNLYNRLPNCKVYDRLPTQQDVAAFMSEVDCGVFPSRAEGWNLELLELMSCGAEIIATNYSAHTEFCNEDNAYLIKVNEVEEAFDGKWFHGQGNWAKLTDEHINELADAMAHVHARKSMSDITNHSGIETARKFSWENTALTIGNFCGTIGV